MAKESLIDKSDAPEIKVDIPDSYDGVVKAVDREFKAWANDQKKRAWAVGRLVSAFLEPSRAERMGKRTIENLGDDVGIKAPRLYEFSRIYEAYKDAKSLERVLERPVVSSTHMGYLSRLADDTARDQMERRVVENKWDIIALREAVQKAMGGKQEKKSRASAKSGPTPKQASKAVSTGTKVASAKAAKKGDDPTDVWEMANEVAGSFTEDILDACVQVHGSVRKVDPGELKSEVKTAGKDHIKKMEVLQAKLTKYIEKVGEYWKQE